MAESNYPQLSMVSTVNSKLSDLPIVNGQLVFVRDTRTIVLDYDDKRVTYKPIVELETEASRTSLLAPVSGSYYYVVETNVLWTYRGGWVQITGNDICHIPSSTTSDNGKFLRVVNGDPAWISVLEAKDGAF